MKNVISVIKLFLFSALFLIFSMSFFVDTYASSIRLIIDGQEVLNLPSPPIMRDDSVLVPARAVFERMGGEVGWHPGNQQVTVFFGKDTLVMTIGDSVAFLNNAPIRMVTPPILANGSTMIPLRFTSEAFGFDVNWDIAQRIAIINSPVAEPPASPTDNDGQAPQIIDRTPDDDEQWPPQIIDRTPEDDDDNNKTDDGIPWPPGDILTPLPQYARARNVSRTPIIAFDHPQTEITAVLTPAIAGAGRYIVEASLPISNVTHFVLYDNRLVLDIHNASTSVTGDIATHHSAPVTGGRIAQHSVVPMVTRVVLHVAGAAEFTLALSSDRSSLIISFAENNIDQITHSVSNGADYFTIYGDSTPNIRISTERFPEFLTINIYNAEMSAVGHIINNGIFATGFSTGKNANGSVFVRIYVGNEWPAHSVTYTDNSVRIALHSNVTGIRYDSVRRELHICRSTGFNMNISQVQHINEYLRLQYTLVVPSQAAGLGRGELSILDGFIRSVSIQPDISGNTRIVFNTDRVLAFSIQETPTTFVIRAHLPRELNPFIVVIDPGHGGRYPGTAHHGLVEKDLVLTVSHMVVQLLNANPMVQVFMTRQDDSTVLNSHRAEFANGLDADLFISIHANAAGTRTAPNPVPHGIETWYTVGALESAGNHRINSQQVAEIMQRHKLARTGANDRGLRYGENLVVLRDTNMPSALLELGFLTNPQEAARLGTYSHQRLLAQAIYDAIIEIVMQFPTSR